MLAAAAKLALAAAVLLLLTPNAGAQSQKIQQLCATSKDRVRCTCILQNGGFVHRRPGGGVALVMDSMANIDRYIACMQRNGRPNG
jgi:hypothetical protein